MNDHIVIDIEIQHPIGTPTLDGPPLGWDDTDKLGVSCGVVYEFRNDVFRVYGPRDVQALQNRIKVADRVTGFNIKRFDLPVIWGAKARSMGDCWLLHNVDDILERIWTALALDPNKFEDSHKGWGLDAVCGKTISRRKSGHGADAPLLFQRGEWGRLVDYCVNDVALTRDLCRFIDRYGYVLGPKQKGPVMIGAWGGGG